MFDDAPRISKRKRAHKREHHFFSFRESTIFSIRDSLIPSVEIGAEGGFDSQIWKSAEAQSLSISKAGIKSSNDGGRKSVAKTATGRIIWFRHSFPLGSTELHVARVHERYAKIAFL
jgi:hypothetical protein